MNLDAYKKQLIEFVSSLNKIPINSPSAHIYGGNNVEKFLDENFEIYLNATVDERKEIRQIIKDHDRSEKDVHEGGPLPAPFRYVLIFMVLEQ